MSTYVVGDIQGCADAFERLLDRIGPSEDDALWLCGDLVNRGPDNLSVLRRARQLKARVVLGNHDLNLLAQARGLRRPRPTDTLDDVLTAPDREELLAWLRGQPFVHREGDWVMVHAGFAPTWSWADIQSRADGAAQLLRSNPDAVIAQLDRRPPPADAEFRRAASDMGVFTRIRMVRPSGKPDGRYAGPPETAPSHLTPWYRASALEPELQVFFGHWAALGHRRLGRFWALDSGCVWGGELTAVRADDHEVYRVAAQAPTLMGGSAGE